MAITVSAKGEVRLSSPENRKDYSLEELKAIVGGHVEIIPLLMVVNEEGILERLPINQQATNVYGSLIVGDVLICRADEIK